MKTQTTRNLLAVDMSPEAIDRRIKELSQLWRLAMSFQTARRLGPISEIAIPDTSPATGAPPSLKRKTRGEERGG